MTSKLVAAARATIETESDVFVMASLLLVECERRRCYVLVRAKRIHKLNPAYTFDLWAERPSMTGRMHRSDPVASDVSQRSSLVCFVEGNMRRAHVRSPAGTAPAFSLSLLR
jgi:hypothetical protein